MAVFKKIIVYGGSGALGSNCINYFKQLNWWVGNVDLIPNEKAFVNITPQGKSVHQWMDQENEVVKQVGSVLQGTKVDAIVCTAGGFTGGNASKDLSQKTEQMFKRSVWSATIATTLAVRYLTPGGVIVFTGAKSALDATPGMLGYGMAKAAVHHLIKSLGKPKTGLPENTLVVGILPEVLDTHRNRILLPKADFTVWTPLITVTQIIHKWILGVERPPNGSLVILVTNKYKTTLHVHEQEPIKLIE